MMDGGLLSLRWNDHRQTFFSMLSAIRKNEVYTDVTLVCDGRFYPVHRLVLSTCSDFFTKVFERTFCKHPIIVVANVSHGDLEALINYMYLGEINVLQADLTSLMKAAEVLKIKGLAEPKTEPESKEGKRLHEEDTVRSKRKKLDEESPTRQSTSNVEVVGNQANSASMPQSGSQASGGESWARPKSRLRSGEPPQEKDNVVPSVYSTDNDNTTNLPSSEVKTEEDVSVKDEPNWYNENDSETVLFTHPSTSLKYGVTGGDGVAGSGAEYPSGDGGGDGGGGGTSATVWNMVVQSQLLQHTGTQPTTSTMPPDMVGMMGRAGQTTSEDLRLRYKRYDSSRSRRFVESWKLEFSWVTYNTDMKVMTCTTCLQYGHEEDKTSSFVSGNSNFKRLSLFQKDTGWEKKGVGGRRKKLTDEERQQLFAIARANPDYSSEVLRNIIISEFDLNISSRTIRRELIEAGLKTLRPRTVFPYTNSSQVDVQDVVVQPSEALRQPNTIHPNTEPPYTSNPPPTNPVSSATVSPHNLPPNKQPMHLS
ncbi:hypothetical protein Pmani_033809 [Petrolisthes manimaculis]|uniref:BTB domain-containing protein n=1 Tax=Petrolisthes manimaculis TaxID=1843537 RepID=A0AAE1NQI7_9EUCA|nr:hypothetical protein Pmani_033809 [Petrolisthes manimaculis]